MGCDITGFLEIRGDNFSRWDKLALYRVNPISCSIEEVEPFNGRNYILFGVLADIRYNSEYGPIVPFRGIPKDASYEVLLKWDEERRYCHSPSWVTLEELENAVKDNRRNDQEKASLSNLINGINFMLSATYNYPLASNVRYVFWFDN